ncbi:hypothetical protein D3C80_1493350 [compost metagenome]
MAKKTKQPLTKEQLVALETDMQAAMEKVAAKHGVTLSFLALWNSVGMCGSHDINGTINLDVAE